MPAMPTGRELAPSIPDSAAPQRLLTYDTFVAQGESGLARIGEWNAHMRNSLGEVTVTVPDANRFVGMFRSARIGNMGIRWITTSPGKVVSEGTGSGNILHPTGLILQEAGSSQIIHGDRTALLECGDMIFVDSNRSLLVESEVPGSMLSLHFSPGNLPASLRHSPDLIGTRLCARSPRINIAGSLLRSVGTALTEGLDHNAVDLVSDMIADSAGLAGSFLHRDEGSDSRRLKLRREICTYVQRKLASPDLTVARLAEAHGLSMRNLQRLFSEMGTTANRYILDQRLEVAAKQLRRAGNCEGRITELAYEIGFNDLSYFHRTFKRKFGVSPGCYCRSS